jgi:hypothetical protein
MAATIAETSWKAQAFPVFAQTVSGTFEAECGIAARRMA